MNELTVESAVTDAQSGAEELRDELQEWFDNMPENLQNGSKAEEIQEAIDALEDVINADITIPDAVKDLPVQFQFSRKRRQSRANRAADFCSLMEAAAAVVENHVEESDELDDEAADEIQTFLSDLIDAANTLSDVTFPGMR